MAETNDTDATDAPWRSENGPCVYCGKVIPRDSSRCSYCHTSFSPAVRQAYRQAVGPWFYLDKRNLSGRGVSFETLVKLVEKGRLRADSTVRGPATYQDWQYAAETPRLSKYLGICPHCFAETTPDQTYCARCQLNMNERPASPRPGVPADLVKQPFHQAAYELEEELAKKVAAAEEARSDIITGPAAPTPTAAGAALVASAAGGFGGAAGRRLTTLLARKPKVWVVLFLTWLTVIPLFLIGIFTPLPILLLPRGCEPAVLEFQAKYKGMLGLAKANPDGPLPSDGGDAALKQWVDDRLRDADNAIATGDFAGAIDIYQKLIDRTGDARWQARATDLRKRIQQQAEQRLADLTGKLEQAQAMADRHQYDDALAVLRNIGPKDRQLLASKGMDVGKMEGTVLKAQQQYQDALRVQAEKLAASLEDIRKLRAARKLKEALAGYEQILQSFPRDLITQHVNIDKAIRDLKAEIQASAAPTPPPPPVAPVMTEKEIITKVADLMEQAVRLEQQEKFNEALAKLGEVKKFDPKYWPETLEKRIEAVKKKKDALDFFGIGGKK